MQFKQLSIKQQLIINKFKSYVETRLNAKKNNVVYKTHQVFHYYPERYSKEQIIKTITPAYFLPKDFDPNQFSLVKELKEKISSMKGIISLDKIVDSICYLNDIPAHDNYYYSQEYASIVGFITSKNYFIPNCTNFLFFNKDHLVHFKYYFVNMK